MTYRWKRLFKRFPTIYHLTELHGTGKRNLYQKNSQPKEFEPRVLIIGAGMAGLTIAKTLHDSGNTNFRIIEGSSRVGGRVMKKDVGGTSVEVGALYIQGRGTNEIYNFTQRFGVSTIEIPDDDAFRDKNGQDITREARSVIRRFEEMRIQQDLDAKADRAKDNADSSLSAAFRYRNWHPVSELEDAVEMYYIDFEVGAKPTEISHKMMYEYDFIFNAFNDETWMCVNDPRGFEFMLQSYANSFLEENDERIIFDEVVTEIRDLGEAGYEVISEDGDSFTGDYVVNTVSVGVLQSGLITHNPALPDWKVKALNKIKMAPYLHMYLQFPSQFWEDRTFLVFAFEDRGKYNMFTNYNHVTPGSNIMQLSLWGDDAREAERLAEKDLVKLVVKSLRRAYPAADIPIPREYAISKWNFDKLTRGGFPYFPPGVTYEDEAALQRRVRNMFFSGDYLKREDYGYLFAAHRNSLKVASELIACIEGECSDGYDDFITRFG